MKTSARQEYVPPRVKTEDAKKLLENLGVATLFNSPPSQEDIAADDAAR